jgi:hypothetical protein
MQTITTIGLDIAKSVFQVHGIDADGNIVIRRQVKRRYVLAFFQKLPPCLVGVKACASSHHWSRELQALGHSVRLMPPAYVKPYVKRHKNDSTDAEAICEAVTRPNIAVARIIDPNAKQGVRWTPKFAWPTRLAASLGDTRCNDRLGHLRRCLQVAARCWRFPSLLRTDTRDLRCSRAPTNAQTPTLAHHTLSSGATARCAESSSSSAHRVGADMHRGNRPSRSAFGSSDEVSAQMISGGRTALVQDAVNLVLGVPCDSPRCPRLRKD